MTPKVNWANEKFGKAAKENANWEKWGQAAESERIVMVAEFHTWAVKKRHECETQLILEDARMIECAPYCRAGLERAASPAALPSCVLEFTVIALEVIRLKQELALLNVYYSLAARNGHLNAFLDVPPSEAAEIAQLWQMFLDDEKDAE